MDDQNPSTNETVTEIDRDSKNNDDEVSVITILVLRGFKSPELSPLREFSSKISRVEFGLSFISKSLGHTSIYQTITHSPGVSPNNALDNASGFLPPVAYPPPSPLGRLLLSPSHLTPTQAPPNPSLDTNIFFGYRGLSLPNSQARDR